MADHRLHLTDLHDSVHNRTAERSGEVDKPINERIQGTAKIPANTTH